MDLKWDNNMVLLNSVVGELRERIDKIIDKTKQNREAIELIKALTEQIAERVQAHVSECQGSDEILGGLNTVIGFTQEVEVLVIRGLEDACNILLTAQDICKTVKNEMLDDSVNAYREMVAGVVEEMQEMRELVANVRHDQETLASRIEVGGAPSAYH